jgi:hypothetical protein
MFAIKRTVFFTSVTVHKNTVLLKGNIEYAAPSAELLPETLAEAIDSGPLCIIYLFQNKSVA